MAKEVKMVEVKDSKFSLRNVICILMQILTSPLWFPGYFVYGIFFIITDETYTMNDWIEGIKNRWQDERIILIITFPIGLLVVAICWFFKEIIWNGIVNLYNSYIESQEYEMEKEKFKESGFKKLVFAEARKIINQNPHFIMWESEIKNKIPISLKKITIFKEVSMGTYLVVIPNGEWKNAFDNDSYTVEFAFGELDFINNRAIWNKSEQNFFSEIYLKSLFKTARKKYSKINCTKWEIRLFEDRIKKYDAIIKKDTLLINSDTWNVLCNSNGMTSTERKFFDKIYDVKVRKWTLLDKFFME